MRLLLPSSAATSGNPLMAALANSLTEMTATLNQVNDKVGKLEKKVDKVESNCAAGFKSLSAALALNQSRDELLRQKLHQQGYAFIDPSSVRAFCLLEAAPLTHRAYRTWPHACALQLAASSTCLER